MHKEIIYPVFLECSALAIDKFWENIFIELSYGRTPYGTYISKNFLCCNYKGKEFSYKIENKDVEQLHNDIYQLLNTKLGLLSQNEKLKKRINFDDLEENIKESRKTWVNIRKKNIKDLLIENYVIKMKNSYELTFTQSKHLLSFILISIIFKITTAKDIDFRDGQIHSIKGISFKDKEVIIDKDLYDTENMSRATQIVFDKKMMSDNWMKYIEIKKKLVPV
jgi:hypothetical protein